MDAAVRRRRGRSAPGFCCAAETRDAGVQSSATFPAPYKCEGSYVVSRIDDELVALVAEKCLCRNQIGGLTPLSADMTEECLTTLPGGEYRKHL
jgi:hypothetical protein